MEQNLDAYKICKRLFFLTGEIKYYVLANSIKNAKEDIEEESLVE